MKILKVLLSICIIIFLNSCIAVAQDTWKSTDGPTKYTISDDVQSDFQKSNPNKILFSVKHLEPGEITAASMSSTFSTNDNIYGTIFMTTCLSNYKTFMMGMSIHNAENKYFVYVYIDGVKPGYKLADAKLAQNLSTKSSFSMVIKGGGEYAKSTNPSFINSLDALPAGDHRIKIEVWAGIEGSRTSQVPIASGEFTFTKKAAAKAPLGSFSDIKAGMKNPELENNILAAMKDYAKTAGWSENYTEAKIISNDWNILRNDMTGAILARTIMAALKATWPDGHCTYQVFTMKQLYDGSGSYQKTISRYATGEQGQIDCK